MPDDTLSKALRTAYVLSAGLAVLLAGAFFAATSLTGDYNTLTRYGGALWVFLLALIIALPTLTPVLKRKYRA